MTRAVIPNSGTQLILLDVNGVLVHFSGGPADFVAGTVNDPWAIWVQLQSVDDFERGRSDISEFVRALRNELDLTQSENDIYREFASWPGSLRPDAEQLLRCLRDAGCRVATISNTNPVHWPKIVAEPALAEHIDAHFPSFMTGHVKPEAKAFESVLKHYGIEPKQAMFFDDRLENVNAAKALGIPGWQVKQLSDIKAILHREGIIEVGVCDGPW
jgi:glucose-1-phosphatase